MFIFCLFERATATALPSVDSLPTCPHQLALGQAEARSSELSPGLPPGTQRPTGWGPHCCLPWWALAGSWHWELVQHSSSEAGGRCGHLNCWAKGLPPCCCEENESTSKPAYFYLSNAKQLFFLAVPCS